MIVSAPLVGLAGLSGLALGSYAVTAGLRLARNEPSARGRSHCDACGAGLSYAQTAPIWSYVRLKGVCGACGARIDPAHLVGELAGGFVLLCAITVGSPFRALALGGLGLLLLTTATVDAKARRLPDGLTTAVALLAAVLAGQRSSDVLLIGLAAAVITFGVLQSVRWASRRGGRAAGLGFGDVKLFSALALWLGAATPWAVVLAALVGLAGMAITRPVNGRLAFGPAIAVAAWSMGMFGEWGWWPTIA